MAVEEGDRPIPPYASWGTVLNLIEKMEREGTPSRIDKSYLSSMSGTTQNQVRAALHSLGLVGESEKVTADLIALATKPDERRELVASMLQSRYPSLVALDTDATKGQLDEVLASYGLNGETLRKARSFFVAAATFAGLPLSPHVKPKPGPTSTSASRRPGRKKRNAGRDGGDPARRGEPPSDADDMKRIYFDLLVDKAKQADTPDPELLNRIERVIGIDSQEGQQSKVEAQTKQD
jgi:hypothetical protein